MRRLSVAVAAVLIMFVGCGGGGGATSSTVVTTVPATAVSTSGVAQPKVIVDEKLVNSAGRWPTYDDQFASAGVVGGGYRIVVKDPSGGPQEVRYGLSADESAISFEADLTQQSGSEVSEGHGLVCYQSHSSGAYLFLVGPAGDYNLLKADNKTGHREPLAKGKSPSVQGINIANHLRADCIRRTDHHTLVIFSVNGSELARAEDAQGDDSFSKIGFAVFASQANTTVVCNNAVVKRL